MDRDSLQRIARCAIALTLASCGAATSEPPRNAERPQTVAIEDLPTGASISEAYRFALRPRGGWRILEEREMGALGPATAGAAARTDAAGWGIVVVESMPGVSLERAAELVFQAMPAEGRTLAAQEPTFFLGYRAIRQVVIARVQEMAVRWVSLMFLHQDHLYRLTVWGGGTGDSRQLESFYETFALLDGSVVRPPREGPRTGEGDDWRIVDGTFESLAANITVSPSASWRIAAGSELSQMHNEAVVGLLHEEPDVYAIVIAERAPPAQYAALSAHLTRTTISGLGGQTRGVRPVRFLGRELPMSILHSNGFEYLYGVDCDDGLCRQLLIWYVEQAAARAAPLLATLPEVRSLSSEEREACAAALARSQSERRTTGPRHAYRGHTYVDFRRGLTLRIPPRAYWRVVADEEARQVSENVELHLENAVLGLHGIFMTEAIDPAMDGAELHRIVREAVGLGPGASRRARLGSMQVEASEGQRDLGFGAMTFRLFTVRVGERGYRFAFWGWPEHVREAEAQLEALLAGVTLHGAPIPAWSMDGDRFVDHRFGYALRPPRGGSHRDDTPPNASGPTSVHTFSYPDGSEVQVLAVFADGDSSQRSAFLVETLRGALERELGGLGAPERTTGTLGGHPAEVSRWTRGPIAVEARIVAVGSIAYGLVVAGRRDADAIARELELLP